jgi:antitoxin HicB
MPDVQYPFTVRQLTHSEGGGFLVEFLDLPGCIADGQTIEEAIAESQDALQAWLLTAQEDGLKIPLPNSAYQYSGQFRARIPKSMHAELAHRAQMDGVSLNSMTIALLAEGLARQNRASDHSSSHFD